MLLEFRIFPYICTSAALRPFFSFSTTYLPFFSPTFLHLFMHVQPRSLIRSSLFLCHPVSPTPTSFLVLLMFCIFLHSIPSCSGRQMSSVCPCFAFSYLSFPLVSFCSPAPKRQQMARRSSPRPRADVNSRSAAHGTAVQEPRGTALITGLVIGTQRASEAI